MLLLTPSDARFRLGILTRFPSESLALTVDGICEFFRPQFSIMLFDDIGPSRQGLFVIMLRIGGQYIENLVYYMVWVLW